MLLRAYSSVLVISANQLVAVHRSAAVSLQKGPFHSDCPLDDIMQVIDKSLSTILGVLFNRPRLIASITLFFLHDCSTHFAHKE
jgi:hypothetical protein